MSEFNIELKLDPKDFDPNLDLSHKPEEDEQMWCGRCKKFHNKGSSAEVAIGRLTKSLSDELVKEIDKEIIEEISKL